MRYFAHGVLKESIEFTPWISGRAIGFNVASVAQAGHVFVRTVSADPHP